MVRTTWPLKIVLWQDIFVVIDDGRAAPSDYQKLGKLVMDQSLRHTGGIGALTLIPPNAVPPSAESRNAIKALLKRLGTSLKCACWLVEGGGFQGAMVRAVLTGLSIFGNHPYGTRVSTQLDDALGWMIEVIRKERPAPAVVSQAARYIQQQRQEQEQVISASP